MENDEPLKKIVTEAERYDINFVQHFDNLIDRYQSVEQIKEILFENLLNSIRKNANKGKTKYSTYIKINPSLNPPKVYNDMALIQVISKLRTSAHDLKIETGRHRGIKREQRLCTCACKLLTYQLSSQVLNIYVEKIWASPQSTPKGTNTQVKIDYGNLAKLKPM